MALGRGLSELLGEVEVAYDNNTVNSNDLVVKELQIDKIIPNPYQPRKIFNQEELKELSDSIVSQGLLQPIIVTKKDDGTYIVVAGERRLRASKLANFNVIKSIIIDVQESKLREYALIENIQRSDLNILEVAYSFNSLLKEHNLTHDELSSIVHKSRSTITNILRLLTLSSYTQKMLSSNKISQGHAKLLVGLSSEQQQMVVDSIIGQKLSVRETEQLIKNLKNNKHPAESSKIKVNKFDFSPLNNILNSMKENDLKVKVSKNSVTFSINSQEDIEKLLKYFK